MFSKKSEPEAQPTPQRSAAPARPQASRERAVLGASIHVEGEVRGQEDLLILGRVDGIVDMEGQTVTVGAGGRVEADVRGRVIVVEGTVQGNLFGTEQLVLRSSAKVEGNLVAPRVALDDGAQFKGAIDMDPEGEGAKGGGPKNRSSKSSAAHDDRPKSDAGQPTSDASKGEAGKKDGGASAGSAKADASATGSGQDARRAAKGR